MINEIYTFLEKNFFNSLTKKTGGQSAKMNGLKGGAGGDPTSGMMNGVKPEAKMTRNKGQKASISKQVVLAQREGGCHH